MSGPNVTPFAKPWVPMDTGNLPIVGQPFRLIGASAQAVIQCQCEGRGTMLATWQVPVVCPSCRRTYVLAALTATQEGKFNAAVGLVRDAPPPVEAASEQEATS